MIENNNINLKKQKVMCPNFCENKLMKYLKYFFRIVIKDDIQILSSKKMFKF